VTLIVAGGPPAMLAAKVETASIPITGADPIKFELRRSFMPNDRVWHNAANPTCPL
jgi:hypothetical protein